jgi:hypothetical protein
MKNIILNEKTLNKSKSILQEGKVPVNYDELITDGFKQSNDESYVKTGTLHHIIYDMINSRKFFENFMYDGFGTINIIKDKVSYIKDHQPLYKDKYKDIEQENERLDEIYKSLTKSQMKLIDIQETLQRINIITNLDNYEEDFNIAIRNNNFLKAITIILTESDILKEKLNYLPEYIEKNLYYHKIDEITNILQDKKYQTSSAIHFLLANLKILLKNGGVPKDDMPKLTDIVETLDHIENPIDNKRGAKKLNSFIKNKNGNGEQTMSKQGAIGIPDVVSNAMPQKIDNVLRQSIRIMLKNNAPYEDNKNAIIRLIRNSQASEKAITVNVRNGKNIREKDFDPNLLLLWGILIGDPFTIEDLIGSHVDIYKLTPEDSNIVVKYMNNLKIKNAEEKQKYLDTINFLLDKSLISPSYTKKIKFVPSNYKSNAPINKNKREKNKSILSKLINNDTDKYEESKKYELNTKAMKLYEERKNESFSAKKYSVKVKHDYGTMKFMVIANSEDEAKKMVMKHENCPLSAIISVKEIGTLGESDAKDEKKKLLNVYHYFIKEKILQYMFKIKSDSYNIPNINNKIVSDDINKIKNIILHAKDDINIITPLSLGNNPIINEIPNIKINRHAKKLDEVNYNITNPEDANGQNIQQQLDTIKSKGYNPATDNITIDKTAMVNSSKTYTKGQIKEMRFNKLFENSKVFTKKELLKNLLVK